MNPLQLYTQTEAAKLLSVSREFIRKHFKPVKISERGTRYLAADLSAFIESKKEAK